MLKKIYKVLPLLAVLFLAACTRQEEQEFKHAVECFFSCVFAGMGVGVLLIFILLYMVLSSPGAQKAMMILSIVFLVINIPLQLLLIDGCAYAERKAMAFTIHGLYIVMFVMFIFRLVQLNNQKKNGPPPLDF